MDEDLIEKFTKENPEVAIDLVKRRGGFLGKLFARVVERCMAGESKFSINFRKGFEKWQRSSTPTQ